MPPHIQEFLKVAASLESLHPTLISAVLMDTSTDTPELYVQATELGLIVAQQDSQHAFLNAKMQQAAYALVPLEEQARFHLLIAQKLARNLTQQELDEHIHVILAQFHIGHEKMTSANECTAIASLCRTAAQDQVAESNFRVASKYLEFGIALMGESPWQNDYNLTLALYNAATEVEYCLANFEHMDELVEQVLLHAHTFRDSLVARSTRVYSLGGRGCTVEAVQEG